MKIFRCALIAALILIAAISTPLYAGSTLFFRGASTPVDPLDLTPTFALANHRMAGIDIGIDLFLVRRVTAADEVPIWAVNPGTNEVKYTSGGSWTAETDTLYVVTWYDQSGNSHDATQSTEAKQPGLTLNSTNGYPKIVFDGGSDFLTIADSDDLSFGDGTDDSAFSIVANTTIEDTYSTILAKRDLSSNPNPGEYSFVVVNYLPGLILYDVNSNNNISIAIDNALSLSSYTTIAASYSGSSVSSGLNFYINGSLISNVTRSSTGVYTAMHNTTIPVTIGQFSGTTTANYLLNGDMRFIGIFPSELSGSTMSGLHLYLDDH